MFDTIPGNIYLRESIENACQLQSDIEMVHPRLVIIDTFAAYCSCVRAGIDMNEYAETTEATRELKRIADVMNIAVVIVHHSRKSAEGKDWLTASMGSQGITGAVDAILYLNRADRETHDGTICYTGRAIQGGKYDVFFDDYLWKRK
jgi:RecA-family ATPase